MNNTYPNLFIIGMPRSGTKLFRNLLNNHSEVFIPDIETLFIPKFITRFGYEELNKNDIKDLIQELKESLFFFYYLKSNSFNFKSLELENITILEFLNCFFIELAKQNGRDTIIIGDKSPNYIHDIEMLLKSYLSAKFIHIVRDPRDYALSVNNAWNKNKERAVFNWVYGIKKIQHVLKEHTNQILEIKYEDLIEDPEKILKKSTDFLSIKYEDGMNTLKTPAENLGDAKSKNIDKNNKQKYFSRMHPKEIAQIESYTIEYLKKYNYPYTISEVKNKPIKKNKEKLLKMADGINLLKFNFKEHGIINGIKKMYKASKY